MSMTKNVATTIKNNNISDAWYGDSEWHDLLKHYVGGDHINITEALSFHRAAKSLLYSN